MLHRLLRIAKWAAFAISLLLLVVTARDALLLNVAQRAASPYIYDLFQWEVANFPDKWLHRLSSALPWAGLSEEEKRERVQTYFGLAEDVRRLEGEIGRAAAGTNAESRSSLSRLEVELADFKARRAAIRDDVEETIEATISAVLEEEGIGAFGPFIWPPVDVRLTEPPKLLVTSPRDRILRTHDVLLRPGVTIEDREGVEKKLFEEQDLAALVTDIGGLATYPASLPNDQPLRWTLQTAAHEWLHHFLFFRPLGQNMFSTPEMQVLNETIADLAGREIGDRVYQMFGGVIPNEEPQAALSPPPDPGDGEGGFDFNSEMRETRLRTDDLLREGKTEEAEAYMEERRRVFVENGHFIRKLNQAYFAFFGTYGDSPSSVSPIGGQAKEFRSLMPGTGEFVRRTASFSAYGDFLDELDRLRAQAERP